MPRILLVEDSAAVTDALRILFEGAGYTVTVAGSIAEAMQLSEKPDIMLLDVKLRDGDGLSLIQHMQLAGTLPDHVIALTGYEDQKTRERCIAAGCRDVLIKPVPTRDLLSYVSGLLL